MHKIEKTIEFCQGNPYGLDNWYEVEYTANFTVDGIFMGLEITSKKELTRSDIYETMGRQDALLLDSLFEEKCFADVETYCTKTLQLKEIPELD